ncbi:MAG TPA: DegT/DnrJ/EryC1/StrS family aminotransferase, partial [Dehalococcoidia bacterium]
ELRHLDAWNGGRRRAAAWYEEALSDAGLQLPVTPAGRDHVYHLYVVQLAERDRTREALSSMGVGAAVHYPVPVHLQRAYSELGMQEGSLPVTESASKRVLSLPMFPEITQQQVAYVADCLAKVLRRDAVSA